MKTNYACCPKLFIVILDRNLSCSTHLLFQNHVSSIRSGSPIRNMMTAASIIATAFTPKLTTATLFCLIFSATQINLFSLFSIMLPVPSLELQNFSMNHSILYDILSNFPSSTINQRVQYTLRFSVSLTNLSKLHGHPSCLHSLLSLTALHQIY